MRTYTVNQTVRKYNVVLNGIRWRNTAMGATLTTLQEMADALPGFLYDFVLTDDHPEMGVKTGSLLVFKSGTGVNHLAIADNYLWLKEGVEYKVIRSKNISDEIDVEDWKAVSFNGEGNYTLLDSSTTLNRPTLFDTPTSGVKKRYNCILIGSGNKTALLFIAQKKYVWDLSSDTFTEMGTGGGGGTTADVTYTNANASVIAVGGIAVGTTFNAKTMQEMWDMALYPEQNPQLADPSYTLSASPSAAFQKVGASVNYLFGNQFNPGKIDPLYQLNETTQKWEATPNYSRVGEPILFDSALENGVKVIILGANTWQRTASFETGVQPKTSKGNNYNGPYAAGSLTGSVTVYGVYPALATNTSSTPSELALQQHGTTITGINVIAGVAVIQIPELWFNWTNVKIWQYDTNSAQYKVIARSAFTEETITIDGVAYKQFTSTETLGARTLQFSL